MAIKVRKKPPASSKKAPAPKKRAAKPRAAKAAPTDFAAPLPVGPRRVVFIDVENTSSEAELLRVFDELGIDLTGGTTEVAAIGNWRVVGQHLGRSLAERGAQLVHSAPAARVSDWSDLWIAVQAGIWLGRSRPGDRIEIVSHDRAFDAVGDASARLGVVFRRVTYRAAGARGGVEDAVVERDTEAVWEGAGRRRRRRGGAGRGGGLGPVHGGRAPGPRARPVHAAAPHVVQPAAEATPIAWPDDGWEAEASPRASGALLEHDAPQGATQDELRETIARLAAAEPSRTITLDTLTETLKEAGFQRPPGSPRLVTRLRATPGVEVLANGKVRLAGDDVGGEADADFAAPSGEPGPRRSRRRGGRRRGGRGRQPPSAPST